MECLAHLSICAYSTMTKGAGRDLCHRQVMVSFVCSVLEGISYFLDAK